MVDKRRTKNKALIGILVTEKKTRENERRSRSELCGVGVTAG